MVQDNYVLSANLPESLSADLLQGGAVSGLNQQLRHLLQHSALLLVVHDLHIHSAAK